MAKLSDKQEMFCKEYLIDLNATQAAIRAGYSEKTARQMASNQLSKVYIQERIAALSEARNKRVQIDADYVLTQAVKLHERCMQEIKPEMINGEEVTDEWDNPVFKFDANGAKGALEIIGKHVKVQAFADKVVSETTITVKETLAERLKRGSKR